MQSFLKLALCVSAIAQTAAAEEVVVTMAGADYAPSSITAAVGDTIRFVNDDGADHNVFVPTATHALDLVTQEPGTEAQLVLRTPGKFDVECVFHSNMLLEVEVGS